jgi:hypothetical protein
MARREKKIPVSIHQDKGSDNDSKNVEYIELGQMKQAEEFVPTDTAAPEKPKMDKQMAENIIDGMIEHQQSSPPEKIDEPDRRHIIMWFGVAFFILIILVVWVAGLRSNFQNVSSDLTEDEQSQTFESIAEQFRGSFKMIKDNVSNIGELTDSIKEQQTQKEAINELKNKIEGESKDKNEPNQLPDVDQGN